MAIAPKTPESSHPQLNFKSYLAYIIFRLV